MAKRVAQTQQKLFSFDLESLLIPDLSPEEQNDSQTFSSERCNHPKKLKTKNSKSLPANTVTITKNELEDQQENEDDEAEEEGHDMAKFFENFGNDFSKSMQLRKSKLGQFTENVIAVYQSKFTDLMKKQEGEMEEFKERTVRNVEEELDKCSEEFKKIKLQESKIIKLLEQQIKLIQKTSEAQREWIEKFRKLHANFIQGFEDLKIRHKNETQDLKKIIATDVSNLQNKFLTDSKKEEMQTMKKYLSSVYF